jgi:hypothetical protein
MNIKQTIRQVEGYIGTHQATQCFPPSHWSMPGRGGGGFHVLCCTVVWPQQKTLSDYSVADTVKSFQLCFVDVLKEPKLSTHNTMHGHVSKNAHIWLRMVQNSSSFSVVGFSYFFRGSVPIVRDVERLLLIISLRVREFVVVLGLYR